MSAVFVGCDPGKKGAMAAIFKDGLVMIIPFDEHGYIKFLSGFEPMDVKCCKSYGWLLGMLDTLGIPYQAVSVQKWKREYGLTSDKSKSIEVCHRLFPNVNLKRTERCKTDSADCAEALLLAEYCRRHMA